MKFHGNYTVEEKYEIYLLNQFLGNYDDLCDYQLYDFEKFKIALKEGEFNDN